MVIYAKSLVGLLSKLERQHRRGLLSISEYVILLHFYLHRQTRETDRRVKMVLEKTIVSTGEHIHFLIITQKNHLNDNDLQVWLPGVINWLVMTQCRICKRGIKHHVKVLTISLNRAGGKGEKNQETIIEKTRMVGVGGVWVK